MCVTRALQESHGIKAIKWDVYCDDMDPAPELLADKADTLASIAMREHKRLQCFASLLLCWGDPVCETALAGR